MKNISYPTTFFDRPFADSGNRQAIPELPGEASARASLAEGFPPLTQLPLNQGGVAPNRLDFNGILHMLSSLAFWQQSGGQWQWSAGLNYAPPSLVFHQGKLWWCVQANGPNSPGGAVSPGTNEAYWLEFLKMLTGGGGASLLGNPVGTIIMFHSAAAPEGYLPCDGSAFSVTAYPKLYAQLGKATTPDMRGLFVRGLNSSSFGTDPYRALGSVQNATRVLADWAFDQSIYAMGRDALAGGGLETAIADYDGERELTYSGDEIPWSGIACTPQRVFTTGARVRPRNIALLYCIKHD